MSTRLAAEQERARQAHDRLAEATTGHAAEIELIGRQAQQAIAADLLDRHPVIGQQRDKCVSQFARRPLLAKVRFPADCPERPAHVRCIELCPERCSEDEPVVLPQNARPQPRARLPLKVFPEHFHSHPGQSQRAPGPLRLGVSVGTYGPPDVDMGRYRRVGVRVALQVEVIPPQCTRLFGSDAYQETQDNVGVQAVRPCRPDQGNGLPGCKRLRRAAFLAGRCVHKRGDIAAHLVVGLGVPDGPGEPGVRHAHRPCGAGGRQVFRRRPDGRRRELTQRYCADDVDQRLQDFPLGADRLRCPASKSIGQPVFDRVCHGVGSVCDYSVVQLVVQFRELGPDLRLVLARHLLAPPLAVRAGLETDNATPAARTMPMGLRVAALPRVIEVDAVFTLPAPTRHGRERNGWLTVGWRNGSPE